MIDDKQSTNNKDNKDNKEFKEQSRKQFTSSDSTEDIVKNINKLKKKSNIDYAAKYKNRINNDLEEKQLIRKMQEMEDKNDKRNSFIMIITFVVIGIIVIWILVKTFSTPLTSILGENKKPKLDSTSPPTSSVKPTVDGKKPVVDTKEPAVKENAVYNYCLDKANMDKVEKKSILLNDNSSKGITAIFIAEILRQNGHKIGDEINNTKLLSEKLQSLGWKKHTKAEELKKGDIAFTSDMTGMPGFPSHVYIFMGWVQPNDTKDGLVCDSLKKPEEKEWVRKRNISYNTEDKQKMTFFMRAPAVASK